MIYVNKGTNNVMTCEANKLNTTGFYLWRFVHDQFKTQYLIYLNPLSLSNRFCKFGLNLPGQINLVEKGYFTYYVYNGDDQSEDFTTMTLLEKGKLLLSE